jgi:hypothetical protein
LTTITLLAQPIWPSQPHITLRRIIAMQDNTLPMLEFFAFIGFAVWLFLRKG